jgi:hypothetical protein
VGEEVNNRILFVSLAIMLALSVGLVGCAGEETPATSEYNLTISSGEGGDVASPGEGIFTYDEGDVIDLVAVPEVGYRFVNWTGDVSAVTNVNAAVTDITIYSDYSIKANFGPEPEPNLSYAIVDTGQDECYDNSHEIACRQAGEGFYGEDAQHDGNQPSYTASADGLTVYDSVTGLTWTQGADWTGDGVVNVDDKFTYAGAQTYVGTLNAQNYGGFSDWRVPSIKELYSLIDYRGTDPNPTAGDSSGLVPFIDDDVFEFAYGDTSAGERIIDSQWATTTLYVSTVMNDMTAMFGVNFADGRIKGYPTEPTPGQPEGKTFYARFCRGNTGYGQNDFVDDGNGTVTDGATGLMWSQSDSGEGMNWEDALAWVQQMNDEDYLGYSDWRLPNAKELQSLVDYTRSPDTTNSAAISPMFEATKITNEAGEEDYPFYWSSTTFLRFDGSATAAVYVAFGRGLGSMDGVNIIDVHGAGCQRSDPKDGNSNDYPSWGHGPQGDVQRVFNYVRCVRDTG